LTTSTKIRRNRNRVLRAVPAQPVEVKDRERATDRQALSTGALPIAEQSSDKRTVAA